MKLGVLSKVIPLLGAINIVRKKTRTIGFLRIPRKKETRMQEVYRSVNKPKSLSLLFIISPKGYGRVVPQKQFETVGLSQLFKILTI